MHAEKKVLEKYILLSYDFVHMRYFVFFFVFSIATVSLSTANILVGGLFFLQSKVFWMYRYAVFFKTRRLCRFLTLSFLRLCRFLFFFW